ncbi:Hypothetical predicted protein [Mytilus galloprovincialis]|uniref:Uncharacterized protein n=1 Tax=Mytilus galloprovincialis TaxID=29158 RepID=A0A8B6DX58_MYTGA|nr:Hypothetical predicted protein [Mytilus galloprovincialis]
MKKLEMQHAAVQNEYVELLLKLHNIHTSSEISFENLSSVIDKDIFRQKLEETTTQENTLSKETNKILKNFASAKDKKGCIKVLKKRFEKALPKCDNGISLDEKADMEDNTSNSYCTQNYEETVMESQANCHNRIHRTTNVTNFNIAGSNVSFNENTQQLSRLNGNNGQYPAIEEGN